MIDPIDSMTRVVVKENAPADAAQKSVVRNAKSAEGIVDHVSINSDNAVDTLRVQVGALKKELPGLVSSALSAPASNSSARKEPLNSVVFRLSDPLKFIIKASSQDEAFQKMIDGFRQELGKFRQELIGLKNNTEVASAADSASKANALNEMVSGLTAHLDGVIQKL
ncbi:MAG: hypothetical protein HY580_06935 [Nitrospinae bacterium]|nr:hypothetical protein [Nitrospinota bacterium]